MFDHVCREALCLIQEPGNMSSFPPLARQACVSRASAQCDRGFPSLSVFLLSIIHTSPSLFSFPLNPGGLWRRMLFQLQCRNLLQSSKNTLERSGWDLRARSSQADPFLEEQNLQLSFFYLYCSESQQNLSHDTFKIGQVELVPFN